jgi:hypothetical protein
MSTRSQEFGRKAVMVLLALWLAALTVGCYVNLYKFVASARYSLLTAVFVVVLASVLLTWSITSRFQKKVKERREH